MRSLLLLLLVAAGCGDTAPAQMMSACKQTFTGDESASFDCIHSLCTPTGYSFISLDSTGHVFHLTLSDALFAVGSYADGDLSESSTLSTSSAGKNYEAHAGKMPIPGQSIRLTLTEVKQPVQSCDGVVHGSLTATLVEYDSATLTAGPGRVNAAITF